MAHQIEPGPSFIVTDKGTVEVVGRLKLEPLHRFVDMVEHRGNRVLRLHFTRAEQLAYFDVLFDLYRRLPIDMSFNGIPIDSGRQP